MFIPALQKGLDSFRLTTWNYQRGRKQNGKLLPTGIREHIYKFPERYGGEDFGINITEGHIEAARLASGLDEPIDYVDADFRSKAELIISDEDIEPADLADAFVYLRDNLQAL